MALWRSEGERGIIPALFGPRGLFARTWQADPESLQQLTELVGEKS